MDSGNNYTQLIVQIDLRSDTINDLVDSFEFMLNKGKIDGFYFLTRNRVPIVHRDQHLQAETRLGAAIAAIQNDDVLIRSLADTDPETGIEYGELT
jgi:hypothetical protein